MNTLEVRAIVPGINLATNRSELRAVTVERDDPHEQNTITRDKARLVARLDQSVLATTCAQAIILDCEAWPLFGELWEILTDDDEMKAL